jgi:uncharacterized RDD family membrane protein YckC/RNA polymerase subunit RPABC4/transcription elongation factor Spt4
MKRYNCPKCNADFEVGTKFCQNCGCNLENEFIERPICPRCHKVFPTGAKFCDVDGNKLTSAEKLLPKCIKCGKIYSADTKFCPDDGGAIIPEALRYNAMQNQNISGFYPKASLSNRFLASLLDGLIMTGLAIPAIICYVLGMAKLSNNYNSDEAVALFVIAAFLYIIPLIYSFIKDGLSKGQSWGKKAVGLMVIYLPDNTPCSIGSSCLRCLVGILLSIIPVVGWLIEPIMVLATKDGRRLADNVASTQVIESNLFNN